MSNPRHVRGKKLIDTLPIPPGQMHDHEDVICKIDIPATLKHINDALVIRDPIVTTFHSTLMRIGNYQSPHQNPVVHFSPLGVGFEMVHIDTGILTAHAIPIECIVKMYYCLEGEPYFVILINEALSNVFNVNMGFLSQKAVRMNYRLNPDDDVVQHRYIIFKLAEGNIEQRVAIMNQFYHFKIVDTTDNKNRVVFYEYVTYSGPPEVVDLCSDEEPQHSVEPEEPGQVVEDTNAAQQPPTEKPKGRKRPAKPKQPWKHRTEMLTPIKYHQIICPLSYRKTAQSGSAAPIETFNLNPSTPCELCGFSMNNVAPTEKKGKNSKRRKPTPKTVGSK